MKVTSKKYWVNAVLHNNESSTDKELIKYFMQGGLTKAEAVKAVNQRQKCFLDMYYIVNV